MILYILKLRAGANPVKDVTLCVKDITFCRHGGDYPESGGVQLLFAFHRKIEKQ